MVSFSSRRRHTRSDRDWSSDVCSSDLSVHPRMVWRVRGRNRPVLPDYGRLAADERGGPHAAPRRLRPRPGQGRPDGGDPTPESVGGGNRGLRCGGENPRLQRVSLRAPGAEIRDVPRGPGGQPRLAPRTRRRARPSRGAEFRGAARGHRPGGPEPERGERGEPRAARDIRPCGARVPPETERAILLPAAGETALGPEAAVPREATRRRPPRDLEDRKSVV